MCRSPSGPTPQPLPPTTQRQRQRSIRFSPWEPPLRDRIDLQYRFRRIASQSRRARHANATERPAVSGGRTETMQRTSMRHRAVALVSVETIPGQPPAKGLHPTVPHHLRNDRRSGDVKRALIPANVRSLLHVRRSGGAERFSLRAKPVVAKQQQRPNRQPNESPCRSRRRGPIDPHGIHLAGARPARCPRRASRDSIEQRLSAPRRQPFRVIDAHNRCQRGPPAGGDGVVAARGQRPPEADTPHHQRTSERPPAGLVNARERRGREAM